MFWRLPPAAYEDAFRERSLEGRGGGPSKRAMSKLVAAGAEPGLLAYRDGLAIGWVGVPRSELVRLEHSPGLRGDDSAGGTPWSISCFSVHRSEWRRGVGTALLDAAIARALEHGATAIEGYPVIAPSVDPYTGYDTMFAAAGFELVRPGRGKGRALWRRASG